MPSTSHPTRTGPEVTAVARNLIASFGHDPELYVPGTVTMIPGTRTSTWSMACSPRCPHPDRRCHQAHAAYLTDARTRELLAAASSVPQTDTHHGRAGAHVPAQRRRA